ncbi:MAG TPA: ABC transporter permease [Devosiaceae bacterium]|nr:ABC transporter permease [Devosiaceae bacterium]
MLGYLLSRLLYAIGVVFGVSVAVFFLIRIGGDPSALFLPPDATLADIARFRTEMGFDRPLSAQYLDFMGRALHGDLGQSLRYQEPALRLVLERVPATLQLSSVALLLALLVSVPLAITGAVYRGSALDRTGLVISMVGESFPSFWLSIMLILILSQHFHMLPASGNSGWQSLIMPAISLAAYSTAIITRLLRSSMIEVLQSDYIRTARGKGLASGLVIFKHALRNAAIPTVTVLGLQIGALLGGAVITEQIFAYPGIGRLAIQAISNRDFTVVQAFVMFTAIVIVVINLIVDACYALLDPRLRKG